MFEEFFIVPGGEVSAEMRAARLFAREGGAKDRFADGEHVMELKEAGKLGIKELAVIVKTDVVRAFLKF